MEDLNFNLIIVIVFLVIGAIRWVIENLLGKKKPPQPEHWEEYDYEERADYAQPAPNSIEDLYEEARREILDRQNRSAPEPEIVQEKLNDYRSPAAAPPPLPPTPGKVRINRPAPAKKEAPNAYSQASDHRPVLSDEQKKAAAAFQQLGKKAKQASRPQSRVRELLASPAAARDAIVLAEILGKPKGAR